MLGFRKSVIIKFASISAVLVICIYIFTFHSENLQPHYDSIKSGLKWNEQTNEIDSQSKDIIDFINKDALTDKTLVERTKFFQNIFKIITNNKPSIEPLNNYPNGKCGVQMIDNEEYPLYTHDELLKYLQVSDDDIKELKLKHQLTIDALPDTLPNSIYEPESKGIVYVGGNKYSWLTLISIMNLREVGCTLPIEVLIPKYEEYELNICSKIFPKYNARCIYLPKLVGDNISNNYQFKGYQYKSLALALSRFEDILLLDADNTPLSNPEPIFTSLPFTDHGLVLWPDFWKRTTHPSFYDIIDFEIDLNNRRSFGYTEYSQRIKQNTADGIALFHQLHGTLPDPTTESGQLLVSKKKHFKTILLSLYYNTYGPDYYYPLLSQGAAGEGDKETFIAAAHTLRRHYYTVKKHVVALGRFRDGNFYGSAMGQFNPIEDYELLHKYQNTDVEVNEQPSILFLHANFPKLDPWSLYKDDITIDKSKDERNRLFGTGFIETAKYDFELNTWNNMKKLLCDEKLDFFTFDNEGVTSAQVCDEVLKHISYLESTL
jgi:alpha 1,2-mannosyltransferase